MEDIMHVTASAKSILEAKGLSYELIMEASTSDDAGRAALAHVIYNVVNDLGSTEDQLRHQGAQLAGIVEQVNRRLEAGQHVNSVGELQNTGVRYDQMCVKRQSLVEHLVGLSYAFAKLVAQDCIRECGRKARPGQDDCQICADELARQMEDHS